MKYTLNALLLLSLGVPTLTACSGPAEPTDTRHASAGRLGADSRAESAPPPTLLPEPPLAPINLIHNGSFEEPFLPMYGWAVFTAIPGWATVWGPGIEIQAWDAKEGRQLVELDSHLASAMGQVLSTTAGNTYELSFSFSPRARLQDNRIGVYWAGTLVQTVDGNGLGNDRNVWTRYTLRLTASSNTTVLGFADLSVPDGVGGHLDDVRVVEVGVGASRCGKDGPGQFSARVSTRALHLQHTATLLKDGSVLATGGFGSMAEVFDVPTGGWTLAGDTTTTRRLHTATLLTDGRVLVAGGDDSGASGTAEVYDPSTRTWSTTGNLLTHRREHQALRLPDGRVLVVGGTDDAGNVLTSAELYDPSSGTWTGTGAMNQARRAFTATALAGGRVLVVGGVVDGGDECTGSNCRGSAEVYDPSTGTWSPTGSLATARGFHSAVVLSDGRVLVSGGSQDGSTSLQSEVYSPGSGTWSATGSMNAPRRRHSLSALSGGWILAAGGYDASTGIASSAELYDPANGTWCPTASMGQARYEHTATVLSDGRVLITAGFSNSSQFTSEVYDPGVK